ncbi:MAG: hypothetical protein IK093_05940, partial [Ruminiclostridium sp.]|nr:hypothetical protein [Ruminiclostridium sp.]
MKKRLLSAALIAALITSFSACGASSHSAPTTEAATKSGDSTVRGKEDGATNGGALVGDSVSGERADGGADSAAYETAPVTTVAPSFAKEEAFAADYDASDYSYADSFDSAADFREPESEKSAITSQARAGLLTGGEWRDNSNFTFWKKLFEHRSDWADVTEEYDLDTRSRIAVRVKDSNGNPAAGLTVKLADGSKTILWETVTDSRGEAFLFPTLLPDDDKTVPTEIIAETPDGRAVIEEVPANYRDTDVAVEMTVPNSFPMRDKLDLMLMVDTTGSMGDELKYLQTELENVINRVVDNTQANVMLSVNFYRDVSDDYVVRDFGFTDRISIALDHLEDQRSGGGGDYPEAVTTALDNGINKHDWRSDSEKIMLLVL